ncbi:MAG: hypothetical protein HFJ59_04090 [Clostridia bacterium]|nr:hypothetical protein [Clostridia bacterium]
MKTKTQIEFGFVDVTAKSDSQLSITDKQTFVNLEDLKRNDIEEVKYATLERNQFVLDGTFELMPDVLNDMCLWSSSMSDELGIFEKSPILVINFSEPHSSLGLTLLFSKAGDYCNHLNITYYDKDNQLINDTDFYPDNYQYVCNNVVENYQKIIIIFYGTNNPYRYLKLYKILYGANKVFEGDNLISANILEEIDLLGSEVSINTLGFKVYSVDDEFNIINPTGFYSLLQERQAFKVKEIFTKENKIIDMGAFYLDSWKNEKDKIMQFEAIDLIGIINKTNFYGGMYIKVKFEDLIKEIMLSANVDENNFEIQEDLKDIEITGYIPVCTHREALQQAVFAIGAIADCSRSDKIKIYTVVYKEDNNTIKQTNVFQGTKTIEQNDIVTGVSITAHNYIKGSEITEVYKGILEAGDNIVLFNDPVSDISCTGGTIKEYNCNYAIIHCVADNTEIIVNGYKYEDNTRIVLVEVEELTSSEKLNTLKVETAYLINNDNAQAIAKNVLDYYQKTYTTKFDFILNEEKLTEDSAIESNSFNRQLVGPIKKLDIDLTGGFLASAEINARVRLLTVTREANLSYKLASILVRTTYEQLPVMGGEESNG